MCTAETARRIVLVLEIQLRPCYIILQVSAYPKLTVLSVFPVTVSKTRNWLFFGWRFGGPHPTAVNIVCYVASEVTDDTERQGKHDHHDDLELAGCCCCCCCRCCCQPDTFCQTSITLRYNSSATAGTADRGVTKAENFLNSAPYLCGGLVFAF